MGELKQVSGRVALLCATLAGLCLAALPLRTGALEAWRSRVSTNLQAVYDAHLSAAGLARFDTQGRVESDVHYDCTSPAPTAALAAAGVAMEGSSRLPPYCVIEGWVPAGALPTLAAIAGVTQVRVPSYARHTPHPALKATAASPATATIDGNALSIMRADQFNAQAGGGGKGVVVGVQSQGIASLATIQGRNELPNVTVLTSAAGGTNSAGADEGTALLQEVHAVAPNAGLAFCEPETFVQYTACLQQFANAGSTVMVDDVLFLDQDPMSSGGSDVQALTQFLTQNPNVVVFSAGGNDNGSYWEGSYDPVPVASLGLSPLTCPGGTQTDNYVHQFSGGASELLTVTTSSAISVPLTFAWADPPGTNHSNFDIYWRNATNPAQSGCLGAAAATGPVLTQSITIYPGSNTVYVATPDASLAGKFLKIWVGGDGLTALSISTPGSFVTPQTFAPGVIIVGAVNGSDGVGNNIEAFSSRGPITVSYPSAAKIQAPTFVAPDGIYVDTAGTYFSSLLFPDGNFYGTSAAAPNAAAVAALLRGAFPNLTVAQLVAALQAGAAQLGTAPPDGTFGYGRIDAMGSLATFPAPTMTALTDVTIDASSSTTSASVPFTVSGYGNLHFSVTSTNSTLVPSAAGSPGVTISPSNCGSTTLTCSLTVTAASYQGGTTTLTVSTLDGAGRPAPATMHVTVNNPQTAPPATTVTVTTPSSGGGGGSLGGWDLLAVSLAILWSVARRATIAIRDDGVIRQGRLDIHHDTVTTDSGFDSGAFDRRRRLPTLRRLAGIQDPAAAAGAAGAGGTSRYSESLE